MPQKISLFLLGGSKSKFQIFYAKEKEQLLRNVANTVISNGGHVLISCGQAVQPNAVSSKQVFSKGSSPSTHVSGFVREMSSGTSSCLCVLLGGQLVLRDTVVSGELVSARRALFSFFFTPFCSCCGWGSSNKKSSHVNIVNVSGKH